MRYITFTLEALKRFSLLGKSSQRVYLQLLCLRNYKTNLIRVTQSRLASRCMTSKDKLSSRSSISKAIKELADKKYIFIYTNVDYNKRIREGIFQKYCIYRILNLRDDGVIYK